jgi:hypothetical protein
MTVVNRGPVSRHGRLFGGDTLYEVLAEIARSTGPVRAVGLADAIGRTPKQTRDELAKLQEVGVLRPVGKDGKALLMGPGESALARAVLSLPRLLDEELGSYARPEE